MPVTRKHRVVAGLLRVDGLVLLCKRQVTRDWYPGVWDLPGGHLGPGERQPGEALARELREELGIEATFSGEPWFEADTAEAQVTIFEVATWTGTVRNKNVDEHSQVAWFAPETTGELELGPLATHLFTQRYATRR